MPCHNTGAAYVASNRATAPSTAVTAPAIKPRLRNIATRSGLFWLVASTVKKMAAIVAQSASESTPIVNAKGVSHKLPKFVGAFGPKFCMSPSATVAAAAPRQKGVMMLEMLNTRFQMFVVLSSPCVRKMNAEPRKTVPIKASVSGKNSTATSVANAVGNPEKRPTTRNTSQTWLTSHTGPNASSINPCCSFAVGPDTNISQMPAPKSAPPKTA